jgi:hypothetical protein
MTTLLTFPHTQWLGRELEKRRQRQLLLGRVPALPKRFCVRESYVAFLCAVRHLRLAWFPKDIRQLRWRHFLKDAPSAPASQQVSFSPSSREKSFDRGSRS